MTGPIDTRGLLRRPDDEAQRRESQEFRARQAARLQGKRVEPPTLPPVAAPPPEGRTHLVIGDSHSSPEIPNHRYDWLGRALTDIQPDVVIDIGDWWDLASLNRYDRAGSKSFEGRRYWRDIEHGVDAQERVKWQLDHYNRGKRKKNRYEPRLIRTLGNHENRINRLLEDEPRWEEMVGLQDLMSDEFGWEEHPFRDSVLVDGIAYAHYYESGVMGRPIGGENPAALLLKKVFHTAVQGHSHRLDFCDRADAMGKKLTGVHAGCYFHHELEWAGPKVNQMYSRGLLILRDVTDGQFDPEWLGMDQIRRKYS